MSNLENPPQSQLLPSQSLPIQSQAPGFVTTYAGFWVRYAAITIDSFIFQFLINLSLGVLFGVTVTGGGGVSQEIITVLLSIVPIIVYSLAVLHLVTRYGATPGKMFFGLRIVDANGHFPDSKTALMREVLGKFVSAILLFFGFLMIAIDREKRGLHDRLAKTHVVFVKPLSGMKKFLIYIIVLFPVILIAASLAIAFFLLRVYRQASLGM